MSDTLDLDALIPAPRIVKIDGNEIEVKQPATADVLKLGKVGQKLQAVNDLPDEEIEALTSSLKEIINRLIPELNGKDLNTAQLMTLLNMIVEMSMPPELEELKKKGITVNETKKTQ